MIGGSVDVTTALGQVRRLDPMPGKTIREIHVGLDLPAVPVVAALNGAPLLRAEWDLVTRETDVLEFVTFHQGGSTKNILKIVALVALAVAAPGIGTAISEAASAAVFGGLFAGGVSIAGISGASIFAAAALIGGSLLINALFSPGSVGQEQPSPTYSLNGQGNSARLMQPIPKQYGRMRMFPDFAAQPWSEFSSDN